MIIKKLKRIIKENKRLHKSNLLYLKELDWANVYHDSIRGQKWLTNMSLNIGRWAGNYAFFYVLNRVLLDYKPKKILEFGLGESTKFVSAFLENYLLESKHVVIEQDEAWFESFKNRFSLSANSKVIICPIEKRVINNYEANFYKGLNQQLDQKFDLYIVDGPFGSNRYSRYDIVEIIEKCSNEDEFIIIFDDYNRVGEQDTVNELVNVLKRKGIDFHKGIYQGVKSVCVIGTSKYRFITSL